MKITHLYSPHRGFLSAAKDREKQCNDRYSGFRCTRKLGHGPWHAAHIDEYDPVIVNETTQYVCKVQVARWFRLTSIVDWILLR
jgi:hypothetical protein